MTTDGRLEKFLSLAREGWLLFPLTADKIPAIKDWENRATSDESMIRSWFEDPLGDGCNFGAAVGRMGVLVIDLDKNKHRKLPNGTEGVFNGADSMRDFLKEHHAELPPTLEVVTPSGGLHLYYRAEGLRGKNGFLPAVDIKSNGGYVVAPWSRTSAGIYSPVGAFETRGVCSHISDLPKWFVEAYNRPVEVKEKPMLNYSVYVVPDSREKVEDAIRRFQEHEEVPEGERNNTLFGFMRDLCKLGITMPRALELYDMYGIPVFGLDPDETEVHRTVESAYRDMTDFGSESQEGKRAELLHLLGPIGEDGEPAEDAEDRDGGSDLAEMMGEEPPPRVWFIENWLSAEPGSMVLYTGRGGVGKSATVLDLMLALATGTPWMGLKTTHPAKSYFVTCEDSKDEVNRRLRLGKRKELAAKVPKRTIRIWSRLGKDSLLCSVDKNGNLKKGNFTIKLKEKVKRFFDGTGGVLVLDTASDIFGGNENDRGAVSRFVKQILADIALGAGCTIIVLAHPAKSGDGYSGSTAWDAAFRGRWELNYRDRVKNKKGVERDRTDGPLVLSNEKTNYTTAGNQVTLLNRGGYFEVVPEMTEAEVAEWEENADSQVLERIAEAAKSGQFCRLGEHSMRPVAKEIIGSLGEEDIRESVGRLIRSGEVEEQKYGMALILVPQGWQTTKTKKRG